MIPNNPNDGGNERVLFFLEEAHYNLVSASGEAAKSENIIWKKISSLTNSLEEIITQLITENDL